MDFIITKRLSFTESFIPQRRKVMYGFSVGVGASLFLLSFLVLNGSVKVPKFQVFPQGSDFSPSFSSWAFPFASHHVSSSSTNATLSSPQGIEQQSAVVNVSGEVSSEKTDLGNITVNPDNASFHGEEQNFPRRKGTLIPEKQNSSDSEQEGIAANASVSNVVTNKTVEAEPQKRNNNVGNSPHDGDVLGKHEGNLVKENNASVTDHDSERQKTLVNFRDQSCDIYDGKWVRDDSKPYYPMGSCPFIDRDFDCHLNGRPDSDYVKWKWQPNRCDIPSLNATDFLERMRGQRLVFVGDSLNRNMWESLVCILSRSIEDKSRVYEISGKMEFKKKGFYAFRFEDFNCSVDFVNTPFLVEESSFQGKNGSFETLRLDMMDHTTKMYHDADILVFNTAHWWTHDKTSRGEDYYQEGDHVHPRLKVLDAYTRALTTWARWVDNNIDGNRTQVVFRGYSEVHFSGGHWNSGGQCHKEMEPIYNETQLEKYPTKMRALEHIIRDMKTPSIYMNITRMTDYRKDAHPSIYRMEYKTEAERIAAEKHQDCSHWCLPGVPDTWNELLYASLLKHGSGNWKV